MAADDAVTVTFTKAQLDLACEVVFAAGSILDDRERGVEADDADVIEVLRETCDHAFDAADLLEVFNLLADAKATTEGFVRREIVVGYEFEIG